MTESISAAPDPKNRCVCAVCQGYYSYSRGEFG